MTVRPNFITGTEAYADWSAGLLAGTVPVLYDIGGPQWASVEIGPELITCLAGPPGAGKTCLAMGWTFEALERTPDLKAVVANVEMTPRVLLDRQLSKMTGLLASDIRFRRFDAGKGILRNRVFE